jgi:copper chaperone CopZ
METKTVIVQGMSCNHCKANVEKGIRSIPGIIDVDVDLQQEKVIISADNLDLTLIKTTVEGLGYSYKGEV